MNGRTTVEVAAEVGISKMTALRWGDDLGVDRSKSGVPRVWTEDEVRLLRVGLLLQAADESRPSGEAGRRWRAVREALPARRRPGGILLVFANGSSRSFESVEAALPWVEDEGVTRLVRIPA